MLSDKAKRNSAEAKRRWAAAHPEKAKSYKRKYESANRDKVNAYQRQWRREHADRSHEHTRKYHLSKYGMTKETLSQMFNNQEGLCAICSVGICICDNRAGRHGRCKTRAHIDHDHGTGEVRGLLCGNCNPAIGGMRDNPAILRNAAAYLER